MISVKESQETCRSVAWSNSQPWSRRRKAASSERRVVLSAFGVRGQGMRTGNLFTSFSSLSTLPAVYVTSFIGGTETELPARAER